MSSSTFIKMSSSTFIKMSALIITLLVLVYFIWRSISGGAGNGGNSGISGGAGNGGNSGNDCCALHSCPQLQGQQTGENWAHHSVHLIDTFIQQNEPIHGILGYSQGGAMIVSYLALTQRSTRPLFNFAIIISGYKMTSHAGILSRIDSADANRFDMPSLLYITENDSIITPDMTIDAGNLFPSHNQVVVRNPTADGHSLPPRNQADIDSFITSRRNELGGSLNILCLHGGGGDAASFELALGMQYADVQLLYLDATASLWVCDPPGQGK